ncbi:MAG TPA: hypothetical protein VF914_12245 [Chloroflexia bacterium]|jgi:hypothetical protein
MWLVLWTSAIMLVSIFWVIQNTWLSSAGVYIEANYSIGEIGRTEYERQMGNWHAARFQFATTWFAVWLAGVLVISLLNRRKPRPANNSARQGTVV